MPDDFSLNDGKSFDSSSPQEVLRSLLAETCKYLPPSDLETIQRAYTIANQAHIGVIRRSGEPYIQYPLEVALLLANMRVDGDSIVAALLHDVVDDTGYTLENLREQFGNAVVNIVDGVIKEATKFTFDDLRAQFGEAAANIVDGVTKFDILLPQAEKNKDARSTMTSDAAQKDADTQETSEQLEQKQRLNRELKRRQRSETVRKMLLAMDQDPRVVVIKLAERLHRMHTLRVIDPAQQQNIARETKEIYAPLARRMGMALVQAELEDLALSYLEPERYSRLAYEVQEERYRRQPIIDKICLALQEEMKKAGIRAEVRPSQKHLSTINRKLEQSVGGLSQIHDLISFHILVDTVYDCYLALGHIHALWRPKDGRIKDFIATPKVNGYQSLHTTVFCLDNNLAEIQIRTHDMQRTADYGIASYWYLKERGESRLSSREMLTWIEQLREWQRELPQNADEFVEAVNVDIFQEQIFVFTPQGEVKDLPRGSTALDMAYCIHTDIGDHCAGARIITSADETGRLVTRIVPLDYELKGGEIVDVLVDSKVHPTRDWLSLARTTTAHRKIRRYLKTYEQEINLQLGRERLDLALKAVGAQGIQAVRDEDLLRINTGKTYATVDELFVALGREDLPTRIVLERLVPLLEQRGELKLEAMTGKKTSLSSGNAEKELPQVMIKLAHCCCPIPGDAIVGVLSPNKGIIVHRSDCSTLRRNRRNKAERLVEVNWLQIEPQLYLAPIIIIANDRAGLLRDVAAVVSDAGINMTAVSSTTNASLRKAVITAMLEIEAVEQIDPLLERLQRLKNVEHVSRDLGRRSEENQSLSGYDWEASERLLHQTLFQQGAVNPSMFPDVPVSQFDQLLKRYMQMHPDADLEYLESSHSLRLRTSHGVQRMMSLLEPVVNGVADGTLANNVKEFQVHMERILRSFSSSVGFGKLSRRSTKDFVTFLIDTEDAFANLRVPNLLPVIASPYYEISDAIIEQLRRSLVKGKKSFRTHPIQVAILILFCNERKLNSVKQRIAIKNFKVHAYDVVVAHHEDLLDILSAREPDRIWRRFLLSRVSLTAIAPYTDKGPTPPHLFFGREHELRAISEGLATTSYIVIGGRRIGKTSVLHCLHYDRLPKWGFRTLYHDCSKITSYDTFFSASIHDWKPDPPAKAPTTFGDLLHLPLQDKPLVLLLDEADKLVPVDRENGWQIFNTLRALVNSRQVQVILSGERTLRDALRDPSSPLFNFATTMILGPLEYSAVEELVIQPMKELEIEIEDVASVVRHVYDFTSGHPHIVQRLCRHLIERLNKRDNRRITLDDVMAITENPVFQEEGFLQTYWEAATPLEKIITLILSYRTGVYRLTEVRELLSKQAHIRPSATETKQALDRLIDLRSLLKRSPNGYEFAVEAFPRVVVKIATIEDLLEQLIEEYNQGEQQT